MLNYKEGYNLVKGYCGDFTYGLAYGTESSYIPDKVIMVDLQKVGDDEYNPIFQLVRLHESRHQFNGKPEYHHRDEVRCLACDMGLPPITIAEFNT